MANIQGTANKDKLIGTNNSDFIDAKENDDYVNGSGGDDEIHGRTGNDELLGGSGNDIIYGEEGNDKLQGGDGDDILIAGIGDDTLTGGNGNDQFYDGAGKDTMDGGNGNDTFFHNYGENFSFLDTINGGEQTDSLILTFTLSQFNSLFTNLNNAYNAFNAANKTKTFNFSSYIPNMNLSVVKVEILNINTGTAPVGSPDNYLTLTEDTPFVLNAPGVLSNDTVYTIPKAPTAILVSGPTHALSFTLNPNGSFSYTPVLNYSGSDSFTYKVNDGFLDSTPVTVTLSIAAVNDPPVITSGNTYFALENTNPLLQVNATDPDSSLSYSLLAGTDAAFFTINTVTGQITFVNTPNFEAPNDQGNDNVYNVTVRVSDGILFTDKALTITVTNVFEPLFTASDNVVNFNTVLAADYDAGTQYDALGGNDIVTLPNAANAAAAGYNPVNTFLGGSGNDQITGGDLNDRIEGGPGLDVINGGAGNDVFFADPTEALSFSQFAQLVNEAPGENNEFNRTDYPRGTSIGISTIDLNNSDITSAITVIDRDTTLGPLVGSGLTALSEFTDLSLPSVRVEGDLNNTTDIDLYKIHLNAGEQITIDVDTATLLNAANFDSYLLLYDSNGVLRAFNDQSVVDSGSTSFNNSFLNFTATVTGDYYIRMESFTSVPVNNNQGLYRMNISITPGDIFNGGIGNDTISFANLSDGTGVTVNLATTAIQNTGGAGHVTITNIENITGSNFDDVLTGSSAANIIEGSDGNDIIITSAGADFLYGGTASVDAPQYSDTLRLATATTVNLVTNQVGTTSFSGFELYEGTTGADTFISGPQADNIDAKAGVDTINYSLSPFGVTVDLNVTLQTSSGYANGDSLNNFENIVGSSNSDILTGNSLNNVIEGGAGADIMDGGAGVDTLSYANSPTFVTINLALNQFLNGDAQGDTPTGFEIILGSGFNDTLSGDNNSNTINGGAGNDVIDGGPENPFPVVTQLAQSVNETAENNAFNRTDYPREISIGTSTIDLNNPDIASAITFIDRDLHVGAVAGSGLTDPSEFFSQTAPSVRVEGSLNNTTDTDLYKIHLNAGEMLIIDVDTATVNPNLDSYVLLYDANGVLRGFNDDGGIDTGSTSSLNSFLTFTTAVTGDYYIRMESFSSLYQGSYRMNIVIEPPEKVNAIDTIIGGNGIDTVTYASLTDGLGVTVNLQTTAVQDTGAGGLDIISSVENLTGSNYNDTLTGNFSANVIQGGDGDDVIAGGLGDDTLSGGNGNDTVSYASSANGVFVNLMLGTPAGEGADTLSGFENIIGSQNSDILVGNDEANIINGLFGSNFFEGRGGADQLIGNPSNPITLGLDTDLLGFAQLVNEAPGDNLEFNRTDYPREISIGTSTIDLNNSDITSAITVIDRETSIGQLVGSGLADLVEFTNLSLPGVRVEGNLDNTTDIDLYQIHLKAGEKLTVDVDTATLPNAADFDSYLLLYDSNGVLRQFNDQSTSSDLGSSDIFNNSFLNFTATVTGDYYIRMESFASLPVNNNQGLYRMNISIEPGNWEQRDMASYANSPSGVTVDLALATAQISAGDASGDVLSSIDSLIGSANGDTLFGNGFSNQLDGDAGIDSLNGRGGDDSLTGGADGDTFVFGQETASHDAVIDYTIDTDVIDLRAWNFTDVNDLTPTLVDTNNDAVNDATRLTLDANNVVDLLNVIAPLDNNQFIF